MLPLTVAMISCVPYLVVGVVLVVSLGCRADTATQEQEDRPNAQLDMVATEASRPQVVPQNAGDRDIRKELSEALDDDRDLRDRQISFIVSNGDVNVTGTVRNEAERQRINDIAMAIPEVRSVANGLRVSP